MIFQRTASMLCGLLLAALLGVQLAQAQTTSPDDLINKVGFDQRLNAFVPPDVTFRDETGATVRLGGYFGAKPVVLMLGYLGCPNLCSLVTQGMVASFNKLAFTIGQEYTVVSVSIDPRETPEIAATKKAQYLLNYGRAGAAQGWHFLTGSEKQIARLAAAVGFRYAYDPRIQQFAHPAGLVVLTAAGRISRYFYGVDYAPGDLRLGLVEASANQIGTPIDQLVLRCYHYDSLTGQYTPAVMNIVRAGGVATVALLGAFVVVLTRRTRRQPDKSI